VKAKPTSHPTHPLYLAPAGGTTEGTAGTIPKFDTDGVSLIDSIASVDGNALEAPVLSATAGTVLVAASDNALEGGQIELAGGGNGGTPYLTWVWDSWTGILRWFRDGVVKMTLDTSGNLAAIGTIVASACSKIGDCGHTATWAAFGHTSNFDTTGYALLQKNDSSDTRVNAESGGQIGLYLANVVQWIVNSSGHWVPESDNNRDIGTAAVGLRDVHIAGEMVGENGSSQNTSAQATFTTTATDIVGASWAVGTNEQWIFDIMIPYLPSSTAGVQFQFVGPASAGVIFTAFGSSSAVTAFSTEYSVSMNSFTQLRGTSAASHFIRLTGRMATGATAGTFKVQGRTNAAGTNCSIRDGLTVIARRIV
jgi:hypothetical protein